MISSILVPLDGSLLSERAAPFAARLALPGRATLHLVRAAWARTVPGTDPTAAQVRVTQEAEEELAAVAAGVRQVGLECVPHVAYGEDPAAVIREAPVANDVSPPRE